MAGVVVILVPRLSIGCAEDNTTYKPRSKPCN
ncbi:hypothetical protein [Pseudomonas phage vB_PaeP_4029]|nr:hypothetical protein [Pseudomonas phage vB_PaeP_4029]UYE96497.1 hypothetical protein [Pseudomonas phage vB_PaeP_4032]UYE96583.1 hypothetical protein [Pseudomonas phage vB_PaeP_4034]